MKTYHVQWSIEIEAESPREAAEKAREIQLDPEYITSFFRVMEYNDDGVVVDFKVIKLKKATTRKMNGDNKMTKAEKKLDLMTLLIKQRIKMLDDMIEPKGSTVIPSFAQRMQAKKEKDVLETILKTVESEIEP